MTINHRETEGRFRRKVTRWINSRAGVYVTGGATSGASIANTEEEIPWNVGSPDIDTINGVTVSGSEITCTEAGTYKFTTTLRVEGNNRVELLLRTYLDTGSGFANQGAFVASNYALRDADQNSGGVTAFPVLELDVGDVVEFRGEADADGTCDMLDNGTRLIIERLA